MSELRKRIKATVQIQLERLAEAMAQVLNRIAALTEYRRGARKKAGTAKRCVNGVVTSATSDVANPKAKRDECDEAYAEKHE